VSLEKKRGGGKKKRQAGYTKHESSSSWAKSGAAPLASLLDCRAEEKREGKRGKKGTKRIEARRSLSSSQRTVETIRACRSQADLVVPKGEGGKEKERERRIDEATPLIQKAGP